MGLFSKRPSQAEINKFGRGGRGSARAAEAYAKQQRDKAATRKAMAARRAAQKKK